MSTNLYGSWVRPRVRGFGWTCENLKQSFGFHKHFYTNSTDAVLMVKGNAAGECRRLSDRDSFLSVCGGVSVYGVKHSLTRTHKESFQGEESKDERLS